MTRSRVGLLIVLAIAAWTLGRSVPIEGAF